MEPIPERLAIANKIIKVHYYCNRCGATLDLGQHDMHNETLSCGCPAHELRQAEAKDE